MYHAVLGINRIDGDMNCGENLVAYLSIIDYSLTIHNSKCLIRGLVFDC